jgi:ABC-type glycerol-3-phosphate transport system substrate-binding protein
MGYANRLAFVLMGLSLGLVACGGRDAPPPAATPDPAPPVDTQVPAPTADTVARSLDDYEQLAAALSAELGGQAAPEIVRRDAVALLEIASGVTPAFVAAQPHCAEYMAAALAVRDALPMLDPETIERDYHADGVLPALGADGAVCYHMKDLVVHPATVQVLLAQEPFDREQAKREIDEAVAHIAAVRVALQDPGAGD